MAFLHHPVHIMHRSQANCLNNIRPNSILSNLLKTCLKPGFHHVFDKSADKWCWRFGVRDFFAEKDCDLLDLSRYLADLRPGLRQIVSKKSRRPVCGSVSNKFDLMELSLYSAITTTKKTTMKDEI